GIQGEVILIIDVDASGNVTNVTVEKSSRNRDLDPCCDWKRLASGASTPLKQAVTKTAGRVRVPVNFALN
ncbi:energy transducer TonB, partial [Stenotrophomonas maltophilia]